MPWVFLVIAGIFEVVWAMLLKASEGFTKLNYSILTILGMIVSFYFLSQATNTLPIGTAYAIWTGIGAVGAVIAGVLLFKEPLSLARGLFMVCIIVGIIGLNFTSAQ
jgi:quaternary ammonium compound-resistance protein SugE